MKKIELRKLHIGDYFRFRNDINAPLWTRHAYDRSVKRYIVYKYCSVNSWSERKGSLFVYVED